MTLQYTEVRDVYGRVYRTGESAQDLMGRSRSWMLWLPWIAMLGVSVYQYGYGAAAHTLEAAYGWSLPETFWVLSIWAVFQGGIAFAVARTQERDSLSPRAAMFIGALLCFLGYLTIAYTGNLLVVLVGYSILGGVGSGLVYATALNAVGRWFPERRSTVGGFVTGGFAYGALPFIFVFTYSMDPGNFTHILDAIAVVILVVVAGCGAFFRVPPKDWWPAHIDPKSWALDRKLNRGSEHNPPAVRQYTPREALRSGMLPLLYVTLAFASGVSLFGIAYQVPFGRHSGFGPFVVAASMGVLALVNGAGRVFVGRVSDRLGRRGTLTLVLLVEGLAQFGLLLSGERQSAPFFLVFAFFAGLGGGAFHPLFAGLVPDYFGESHQRQNFAIVYSAKLVGGVVGIGLAGYVVSASGYRGAFLLAGCVAVAGAVLTRLLHRPGYPTLVDPAPRRTKLLSL